MQRIQKNRLLMALVALFLAACGKEPVLTVADYLHDMDKANSVIKNASNDPARFQNDGNYINASSARGRVQSLNDCWPKNDVNRFSTANTDHACLDTKGYRR